MILHAGNMCSRNRSVHDAEIFKLTGIVLPGDVDMLHDRSLWAVPAPFDKFLDFFFGPFTENLHAPVSEISHGSHEANFIRLLFSIVPKVNALDETADQYLCPSHD